RLWTRCHHFNGSGRADYATAIVKLGWHVCEPLADAYALRVLDSSAIAKSGDSICFFFQAEDGIRDLTVTGVQTCALPISRQCAALPATATRAASFSLASLARTSSLMARSQEKYSVSTPASSTLVGSSSASFGVCSDALVCEIGRASCRERG